jgi:dTDP-4-dehydrorhamnose reductase
MKVLVLGKNGFLGSHLVRILQSNNKMISKEYKFSTEVFSLSVKFYDSNLFELKNVLENNKFHCVINCIALTNLEYCEKNMAQAAWVNSELPGLISKVCREFDVKLLHFSTDAVFDGTLKFPSEMSLPNPISVYGMTKLIGEQNVLDSGCDFIIARVNFFGYSHNKMSVFKFFLDALKNDNIVYGYTDVKFTPLYIGYLVDIIINLIEENLSGLYHIVGSELVSKYEFGVMVAQNFGYSTQNIKPSLSNIDLGSDYRSKNLGLSNSKIKKLGIRIPSLNEGLIRLKKDMEENNEFAS